MGRRVETVTLTKQQINDIAAQAVARRLTELENEVQSLREKLEAHEARHAEVIQARFRAERMQEARMQDARMREARMK